MEFTGRKLQRLRNYDYGNNNAYFVTICSQNRLQLFGRIEDSNLLLNDAGEMVSRKFGEIQHFYPDITIDKFVVMPNHLHGILLIGHSGTARGPFPTMALSDYVQRFKSLTTKLYIDGVKNSNFLTFNKKLWQKSFYDRIIRNKAEYQKIWEYIDNNPLKWELDKYYSVSNK